eukprot:TRINITY_DN3140_c0_g1_i1.p1 TRINITY_DN3140_c0_g1~~TRINITY_DN3140_c0_g1_i1.p1  ORF type:complete len:295 (+),score=69.17 TRINITY_DN3140_c0_g1_i1:25-885(+)
MCKRFGWPCFIAIPCLLIGGLFLGLYIPLKEKKYTKTVCMVLESEVKNKTCTVFTHMTDGGNTLSTGSGLDLSLVRELDELIENEEDIKSYLKDLNRIGGFELTSDLEDAKVERIKYLENVEEDSRPDLKRNSFLESDPNKKFEIRDESSSTENSLDYSVDNDDEGEEHSQYVRDYTSFPCFSPYWMVGYNISANFANYYNTTFELGTFYNYSSASAVSSLFTDSQNYTCFFYAKDIKVVAWTQLDNHKRLTIYLSIAVVTLTFFVLSFLFSVYLFCTVSDYSSIN